MSQSNGTAAPTSSGQGRNAVNLHLAKVEEFIADPKRTKGQLAEMVEISKSYNQDDRQSYSQDSLSKKQPSGSQSPTVSGEGYTEPHRSAEAIPQPSTAATARHVEGSLQEFADAWAHHAYLLRTSFCELSQKNSAVSLVGVQNLIFSSPWFQILERTRALRFSSSYPAGCLVNPDSAAQDVAAPHLNLNLPATGCAPTFPTGSLDGTMTTVKDKLDTAAGDRDGAREWVSTAEICFEHMKAGLQEPDPKEAWRSIRRFLNLAACSVDEAKTRMNTTSIALHAIGIERETLALRVKLSKLEIRESHMIRTGVQELLVDAVNVAEEAVAAREWMEKELNTLRAKLAKKTVKE